MVVMAVFGAVLGAAVVGAVLVVVVLRHLQRTAVDTVLSVASERLGQQTAASQHELDLRSEAIHRQLGDMTGQLQRVSDLVGTLQRERAEQHGQLVQGLSEAARTTASLAETTQSLRQALASPKARGQWGERMADDVLRLAGFVEGVSYRKQTGLPNGTIPDFTFLLPSGLFLHMDVKFPVDNYLRFLDGATTAECDGHRTQFLRDVRARIRDLAARGYADGDSTVGYVLLFIPNESVYGFIHECDPGIVDAAIAQRVVLCSPTTLFAVLAVVRHSVDTFLLERSADEILDALAGFRLQWQKFSEQLDTVGSRLESTQRAYDDLAGTRRRQLEKRLDAIDAIRERHGLDAGDAVDELRILREVNAG